MVLDRAGTLAVPASVQGFAWARIAPTVDGAGAAVPIIHDQGGALGLVVQFAVMRDGRVRQVGAPRDVYLRPRNAEVASVLTEAVILGPRSRRGSRPPCSAGCWWTTPRAAAPCA